MLNNPPRRRKIRRSEPGRLGRKAIGTLLGLVWLLVACGCASDRGLTVVLGPPEYYRSRSGERYVARYGRLSDGSLDFVKVTMPDGREVTLPQAVSASGARYTDDRELVWWEHQGAIRVDVRGADGAWVIGFEELSPGSD